MFVLVTGVAGFIGSAVARALLESGHAVIGLDNRSGSAMAWLVERRLLPLREFPAFRYVDLDIAATDATSTIAALAPERVIHLAAKTGVRASRDAPAGYLSSNIGGFDAVIEACRIAGCRLVYASSSSVYGDGSAAPGCMGVPLNVYAATKQANEQVAAGYAASFGLDVTGLRFFTVYGPNGRPDMAMWQFAEAMLEGRPIVLHGEGRMTRDFTWIGDVVESVIRVVDRPTAEPGPAVVHDVGVGAPVSLPRLVALLEDALGVCADVRLAAGPGGEMSDTRANPESLRADVGYAPSTSLEQGVPIFAGWLREWHAASLAGAVPA